MIPQMKLTKELYEKMHEELNKIQGFHERKLIEVEECRQIVFFTSKVGDSPNPIAW